ncbi:MAG: cache domain-containing protein, partial [Oscillospiraceae bacterium]|nr:cache domain-containing protein [Oscillospiraceae bacterium]
MSKIGKSIVTMVAAMLVFVTIVITAAFLFMHNKTETSNLKNSSQTSVNVLQHNFNQRADDTITISELLSDDAAFLEALAASDSGSVKSIWDGIHKNDGMFGFFTNSNGILVYKTDNCYISDESIFNMTSKSQSGLFVGTKEPLFFCTSVMTDSGAVAVGYSYSNNSLVDDLMAQTQNHATIFADNVRIATTMLTDTGERATGTLMLDNIYQTFVKSAQVYQQEG